MPKQKISLVDHCVSEVGRLAGQDFFKSEDSLIADLAKALATTCDDSEHATRMISTWKAQTRTMLHESDLRLLADQTRPAKTVQTFGKCRLSLCAGMGWIRVFSLWTRKVGPTGYGFVEKQRITEAEYDDLCTKIDWQKQTAYSGVKQCECGA